MKYAQHPLSAAFPAMHADEYQALLDSVIEIGVQAPITLFDGMVIDGWHRYSAATEVGMHCPSVELGDIDPVEFVKSQNLHRRHLTGSQRAAAIVACSNWHPAHREKKSVPGTDLSKTDAYMAKEAGVSISTVGQVKAAQKAGLIDVVRDGGLSAKEAAIIARGTPSKPALPIVTPAIEQDDDGAPDDAELASFAAAEKADAAAMHMLLASDAPLADVTEKYKQSLLQISQLDARIIGLQNENIVLIRTVKSLQNKLAKLEQPA